MTTSLDKTTIQKAKEILQLDEELSAIELLRLLKDYRKKIHPDKFTEASAISEAEAKFKEIGTVVEDLERYIQQEKLNRSAQELALYNPLYENVYLQTQIDELIEKNRELESEATTLRERNKDLDRLLKEKKDSALREEVLELKNLYKPSGRRLASLGAVFLLTVSFGIMTKIEETSTILKTYSPIPEGTINTSIFFVFLFLLFLILKELVENYFISHRSSEVCSAKFSKEFVEYIKLNNPKEENKPLLFSESDVFNFIYGKNLLIKRMLPLIGFRLFHSETVEKLKNLFISSLLNRKLIEITYAEELDRMFAVRDRRHYYW